MFPSERLEFLRSRFAAFISSPHSARLLGSQKSVLDLRRLVYLRDLLRELVARDMKLRYKHSVLGVLWSLLNPLLQLLVYAFVFSMILPINVSNYLSFLFTGILVWSWFHTSLLAATGSVVDNRDLVRRPGFPVAVLPAVVITSYLVHFVIALPILFVCIFLQVGRITNAALALPLVIGLQFIMTLGLAFFVSAIHVTFRDTQYLLTVLLQLMMFLTPVFYDANNIPTLNRAIYNLNPMTQLLEAYRTILLNGTLPDIGALLVQGLFYAVLLFLGYRYFMRTNDRFVEEI